MPFQYFVLLKKYQSLRIVFLKGSVPQAYGAFKKGYLRFPNNCFNEKENIRLGGVLFSHHFYSFRGLSIICKVFF